MIGISISQVIQGPLVTISFLIFTLGVIAQSIRFYRMSRPVREAHGSGAAMRLPIFRPSPWGKGNDTLAFRMKMLRHSVFGVHPGMMLITAAFHACVLVTPFFILAHNIILDLAFGVHLPSFPDKITDALIIVVIGCGFYFLCRRIFIKRVRAITGVRDYLMLVIATAPFITGCLAHQQVFEYNLAVTLHILSAEILLIVAPFSKLVHMIFFFFGRFFLLSENNLLGGGNRVWR